MSFQESAALREERRKAVVGHVLAEYDDLGVALILERRLQVEQEAFGPDADHAGPMVAALVEARPEAAGAIVQRVIADPKSWLGPVLPVVLGRLGEVAPDQLVKAAEELLALQVSAIDTFVSRSFGWNRGPRSSLVEGELELLRTFARHPDPSIRESALAAAELVPVGGVR